MHIECHAGHSMTRETRQAIGSYRQGVFVQSLGWDLQYDDSGEHDEFDTGAATHLLAHDEDDAIVGYARLLTTTGPYLLGTHFAHLLNGGVPPCSPAMWELSRYSAEGARNASLQTRIGKRLLLEAAQFAAARGARQLVCCTSVGIERLANRWGVEVQRLGPPQRAGNQLLVAAAIQLSERTRAALSEGPSAQRIQHYSLQRSDVAPLPLEVRNLTQAAAWECGRPKDS